MLNSDASFLSARGVSVTNGAIRRMMVVLFMLFSTAAAARTVTDIDNKQVTIPDHPQRIVLGESRMLYTLAMLEPGDPFKKIAGWPLDLKKYDQQTWDIFAKKFPQMLAIPSLGIGSTNDMNPEKVMALKPDVVILPSLARYDDADLRLESLLRAAHIPVVKIDLRVHLLKNTTRSVQILGEVLNQPARAQAFNRFYDAHMQAIQTRLATYSGPKPRVLLQLHLGRRNECCVTAVKGSLGDLLAFAGGDNIASKTVKGVFGRLSEEAVIAAQPDVYIATGAGNAGDQNDLLLGPAISSAMVKSSLAELTAKQNGLRELKALHNGRTAAIWQNFYLSPWHVVATEFMAKTLYPELFADLDPETTLQDLFREFLPVPLSGTFFATGGTE